MNNLESLQCLLVQTQLFWADADANRRQLQAIARSRGADSDLIVFPETFTSGFLSSEVYSRPRNKGNQPGKKSSGSNITWVVPLLQVVFSSERTLPVRVIDSRFVDTAGHVEHIHFATHFIELATVRD